MKRILLLAAMAAVFCFSACGNNERERPKGFVDLKADIDSLLIKRELCWFDIRAKEKWVKRLADYCIDQKEEDARQLVTARKVVLRSRQELILYTSSVVDTINTELRSSLDEYTELLGRVILRWDPGFHEKENELVSTALNFLKDETQEYSQIVHAYREAELHELDIWPCIEKWAK